MRPIRLILFDLDDTLVHFDDYWEISVKETFTQHDLTSGLDTNEMFAIFEQVNARLVEQLDKLQITVEDFRIQRFLHAMALAGKEADAAMASDFEQLYQAASKRNMKPDSDANKLIGELQGRYQVGIITNGSKDWQMHKLEAIELNEAIQAELLFISGAVGHEKPTREIYQHIVRATSLQPDQILVVGDSWTNDVAGPMDNGMQAVWFNKKGKPVPQGHQPLAVIRHLSELRALLLSSGTEEV
ncbi:HAD family hydrolase [Paenibacillus sacheonensis]|uniref:HAD-IA family hydrolase n=1 Tax=Paenibacillus sacheonensis TaxID=742054 RepID=A0A7X5BYZ6_9BACL|nr:HAD family hydrolase [Paenibacillus sacheonensis]MBM7565043.1 putative hydrolase of the HAD superfamily [Paenibacillus sacheonensis]NBC70172.1 HAD-IA family hydrolase [Paenibacillus sacheonensis]